MSNNEPTHRDTYRPGMVVNGWQLGEDGQWRLYREPSQPKPWYRRTWVITTAVVTVLSIAALASGAGDDDEKGTASKWPTPSASSSTPTPTPEAEPAAEPEPEPVHIDPDVAWVAKAAPIITSQLPDIADEMGAMGESASNYDVEGAVRHAQTTASMLDDLIGDLGALPETDKSQLGGVSIATFAQCKGAATRSAVAIQILDTDMITAATEDIQTCGAGIEHLTARVTELTS